MKNPFWVLAQEMGVSSADGPLWPQALHPARRPARSRAAITRQARESTATLKFEKVKCFLSVITEEKTNQNPKHQLAHIQRGNGRVT